MAVNPESNVLHTLKRYLDAGYDQNGMAATAVQTTIARPSVASLYLQVQASGNVLSTATGFLVKHAGKVCLVTNRHVVRGRDQGNDVPLHPSLACPDTLVAYHHVANMLGAWVPKHVSLYTVAGDPQWLEHPTLGGKVDVVALPLTDLAGVDVYEHNVTNEAIPIGPSETVSIVGFPFGLSAGGLLGIWSAGTIASEPAIDFDNLPSFLVDSRTRKGQSGSPVVVYRPGPYTAGGALIVSDKPVEQLLGVYSGRINPESDLGIVWKVRALKEILAQT